MTLSGPVESVWTCGVCELTFQTQYRYKRHLATAKHVALASILSLGSDTPESFQENSTDDHGVAEEIPISLESSPSSESDIDDGKITENCGAEESHTDEDSDDEDIG